MCKREIRQIKLYSFFSGCGLLDLGMERAGFNIAMVSGKYEGKVSNLYLSAGVSEILNEKEQYIKK